MPQRRQIFQRVYTISEITSIRLHKTVCMSACSFRCFPLFGVAQRSDSGKDCVNRAVLRTTLTPSLPCTHLITTDMYKEPDRHSSQMSIRTQVYNLAMTNVRIVSESSTDVQNFLGQNSARDEDLCVRVQILFDDLEVFFVSLHDHIVEVVDDEHFNFICF